MKLTKNDFKAKDEYGRLKYLGTLDSDESKKPNL
jgi:hypothetical protein